ncbi:PREDICTED: beta-mannosidase [Rhagoletis zephyria]|uniref:beta-mannosidase n=1 Tax=Rhagoletis zephyria TaxID=28612 RepID=UPI000811648E|nr:PREDICTED: beta-mannosidase [Rhagoletis zephyria]
MRAMKLKIAANIRIGVLVVFFAGWLCNLCGSAEAESVYVQDLKGLSWTLTNGSYTNTRVKIPSGVYSAIAGEDVLKYKNDVDLRYISYDNWTYSLEFAGEIKDSRLVNLTFHGIDTISEIYLNGHLLGHTDNMFVRYTYEVGHILEDVNRLVVRLTSPVHAARARADELTARNISVPPACPPVSYRGECHMNMLRKMQASFSWDWGLAAPSMGIWKTVTLEFYQVALIRDVDVAISRNETHWNMHIRVFIDSGGKQDFYAELKFYAIELMEEPVVINTYSKKTLSWQNPVLIFDQAIPIENVTLWWPNGYGDQKLYPLHFSLKTWLSKIGPSLRARTTSTKSIHVGFRTIELIEDEAKEGVGDYFLFKVNDVEIFMKGTNYIPMHILPELSYDEEQIIHLMRSVKEANMNMIRVWGGGVYESNRFYEEADKKGILIWQDMMFACAMYPATEEFLASVRKEIIQNAKRIAYHPSIAIIATNNENEAALVGNWYGTAGERARFEAEYRELYIGTVFHELKIIQHSSRPKPLMSSPSNARASEKDNYISNNPGDENYGDIHFYTNFEDAWDPNIYRRPRFASEYGFQSLPKLTTWQLSMHPGDNLLNLIHHRQHHPANMTLITALIRRHLPLPLPEDDNYVEALIYFSQISQAMATKIETELYRSLRDTVHHTMGALYWQLNDVWVAPSWSSIDFYGNYKLLHYWAKSFMAPIHIVALYDSDQDAVNVSLICDKLEVVEYEGLEVSMNIYKWSDLFPKVQTVWPVTLKPNGVHYDKIIPVSSIFPRGYTKTNSFVEFVLRDRTTELARNFYFPSPIKDAEGVSDPQVTLRVFYSYCYKANNNYANIISLNVSVAKPAIFLYLELLNTSVARYKLSNNGFMMLVPTKLVHLEFFSSECLDIKVSDLKVLTVNQYML